MITVKIVTRRSPEFTLTRTKRISTLDMTSLHRKTWHQLIDLIFEEIDPFEKLVSITIIGSKV